MKIPVTKNLILIATLSTLSHLAFAQLPDSSSSQTPQSNGGGLRDGGHSIRQNGQARLLDYIERGGCQTRTTGAELLASLPELSRMLTALKRVDWIFAQALETELNSLQVCMGNSIEFVQPRDPNGVFRPEPDQNLRQAAVRIRWSPYVYANLSVINALPAQDYAGLWIHEALHSFIGFRDGRHYEHVRSVNRAIRDLTQSGSTSRPAFHRILDEAGLRAPRATALLDRYQYAFEFAWSSSQSKATQILQAESPETLVISDETYFSLLPQLGEMVLPLSPMSELIHTLQTLLIEGSFENFEMVLTQKTYTQFSIGDIALEVSARFSPQKRQKLFELLGSASRLSLSIIDNVSAQFTQAQAFVNQSRICGNFMLLNLSGNELNMDTGMNSNCMPIMSLSVQNQNRGTVTNHQLGAAAQWIRELAAQGQWEIVTPLVAPEGRLRAAFNMDALIHSIAALPERSVSIRREKRYAIEQARLLQNQIWVEWVHHTALGMNEYDQAYFYSVAGVAVPQFGLPESTRLQQ